MSASYENSFYEFPRPRWSPFLFPHKVDNKAQGAIFIRMNTKESIEYHRKIRLAYNTSYIFGLEEKSLSWEAFT